MTSGLAAWGVRRHPFAVDARRLMRGACALIVLEPVVTCGDDRLHAGVDAVARGIGGRLEVGEVDAATLVGGEIDVADVVGAGAAGDVAREQTLELLATDVGP